MGCGSGVQGVSLGSGSGGRCHFAGCMSTVAPGLRRHPSRSGLAHAERGNPVAVQDFGSGGPTAREAELCGGNRMVQEANAGAPKGDRKIGHHGVTFTGPRSNWPDTRAWCPGPKGR